MYSRKSTWVTVISDDLYRCIRHDIWSISPSYSSSHPTLWKDEKLTKLPKMWSSDSFFSNFPPSQEGACWLQKAGPCFWHFWRQFDLRFLEPRFWRLSGVSQVEKPLKTWQPLRFGTVDELEISGYLYIYIHIYTRKPGRSPTRQYGALRPFLTCAPSLDFFWVFQEDFSSCNSESSQFRASGWKALDGLTAQVPLEQASRYSFKAVSTEKSPGQRCSLAAAKTWTFFFFEEAAKQPTLFIRLRVPLMAPNRLSALLSPPATKKQRWVSLTRPCRRLAWDWSVFSWEAAKHPFQSFTVGVKILVKCETPFKWTLPIFKATLLKAGDPSAATKVFLFSPFRSTWNTGYITCLGMCKVCTEAVRSVALETRVTLHIWSCVKYVPKQSIL